VEQIPFKRTPLASVVALAIAGAPEPTSGASDMQQAAPSLKISGQVNRAAVYMDNDEQTDVQYVDNSASGTRFRLTGDTTLDNGLKVGFVIENQYQDNPSADQDVKSPDKNGNFKTRKQQIWVEGGFGKLGQKFGNHSLSIDYGEGEDQQCYFYGHSGLSRSSSRHERRNLAHTDAGRAEPLGVTAYLERGRWPGATSSLRPRQVTACGRAEHRALAEVQPAVGLAPSIRMRRRRVRTST